MIHAGIHTMRRPRRRFAALFGMALLAASAGAQAVEAQSGSERSQAIARVVAARQAGADASFVEAPDSADMLQQIGQRSPGPNVANMIEGGRTPVLPKDQLVQLGFHIILYPLAGLFAATRAIEALYQKIHRDGTSSGEENRLTTFDNFNALIGLEEKYELAKRFDVG